MVGQTMPCKRPGVQQVFYKRVFLSCFSRTLYPTDCGIPWHGRRKNVNSVQRRAGPKDPLGILEVSVSEADNKMELGMLGIY